MRPDIAVHDVGVKPFNKIAFIYGGTKNTVT